MNKCCEVKYDSSCKCWVICDKDGNKLKDKEYKNKQEALDEARCFCEETGSELSIYDRAGNLTSRRRINNMASRCNNATEEE